MTILELKDQFTDDFRANTEIIKSLEDLELPKVLRMKIEPYPYQKVGAFFLWYVKKCFLLDDAGMGKTIQSITYIKLIQILEKKSNVKALVVTTSSILYQWEEEIRKFSNLLPVVVDGKSKKARQTKYKNFLTNKQNVMIINYTKIIHDFDDIICQHFDTIIFDEASALKDSSTKIHQFYKFLTQKVNRVVMLTATPISNNLEEFYNLFQLFHNASFLPEYPEFREQYLETKPVKVKRGNRTFTIETVTGSKIDMIPRFRELISPYYIRRLNTFKSSEMSKLKLNIKKIGVPMTKEQKALCHNLKMNHLADDDSVALKLYSDFCKVSCAPCIQDPQYSNFSPKALELIHYIYSLNPFLELHHKTIESKIADGSLSPSTKENIYIPQKELEDAWLEQNIQPKKLVVFATYIEFHKILRDYLDLAGVKYVSITGEQSPKEKEQAKQDFNEDPFILVMLITGAGKFGLNLQITNKFVFTTIPYTPSDVFQYIGRVLRTGQTEDVEAIFLYNENSLEEDLFDSLYRKQLEIDTFFEQDKAEIFTLTKDTGNPNVRQSFISRNYLQGRCYDDQIKPDDFKLVPEKKIVEQKTPEVQQEEDFYKVGLIDL